MKIAVCVKFVPSVSETRLDAGYNIVREGIPHILNIADESALEAALQLRGNGSVTLITMGTLSCGEALRSLLSRGADSAVLLNDSAFVGSDTYATAGTLAAAITKLGGFDLILCGRHTLDSETGQVPPALASLCGIPFITNVLKVSVTDSGLECHRLLETGTEKLHVSLPAVVSLCEYSYTLRLASISGIRKAKGSRINIMTRNDLNLDPEMCGLRGSPTRVRGAAANFSALRAGIKSECLEGGTERLAKLIREAKR